MSTMTISVLGQSDVERLHAATLRVLREVGVEIGHQRAAELLAASGAAVEGTRARIPEQLVEQALSTAPRSFRVKWRGLDRQQEVGSGAPSVGTGMDCPYVRDLQTSERRRTTREDMEEMAALAERLPNIDYVSSMGLPEVEEGQSLELVQVAAMLCGTRKPLLTSSPGGGEGLRMVREMAAVCGEADSVTVLTMPDPPLQHGPAELDKLLVAGELGMPICVLPGVDPGSAGPCSLAGSIVVANAEALSALVVHQLAHPGAPFVYGSGIVWIDPRMAQSISAAPEAYLGNQACIEMARHYGLPSAAYAMQSDAKIVDEELALEYGLTAALSMLSGASTLGAVGVFDGVMQSAFEALVLADEITGYMRAFRRGVATDDEALALDEVVDVGPGGMFLGRDYTRTHIRDFWLPTMLVRDNVERWERGGAKTLGERLRERTRALLAEQRPFVVDDAARQELERLTWTPMDV